MLRMYQASQVLHECSISGLCPGPDFTFFTAKLVCGGWGSVGESAHRLRGTLQFCLGTTTIADGLTGTNGLCSFKPRLLTTEFQQGSCCAVQGGNWVSCHLPVPYRALPPLCPAVPILRPLVLIVVPVMCVCVCVCALKGELTTGPAEMETRQTPCCTQGGRDRWAVWTL